MTGQKLLLIVGATSKIGSSMMEHAARSGLSVLGTTREGDVDRGWPACDLEAPAPESLREVQASHAIIVAGRTSIAECERDPESTRAINVTGVVAVARALAETGTQVTVTSSSTVFSRHRAYPNPREVPDPVCEYGRQKAEMEARCLELEGTRVVRLTKVLTRPSILETWREAIAAGESIRPFANLSVAPLRLSVVVPTMLDVALGGGQGRVIHLSPPDEMSYASMAHVLCEWGSLDESRLHPVDAPNDPSMGLLVGPHAALGQPFFTEGIATEVSTTAVKRFLGEE